MIATKTKNTFVPLQQPLTRHTKKKANLKFNFIVSCRSTIFLEIISLESAFLFLLLELLSFCFAKKKENDDDGSERRCCSYTMRTAVYSVILLACMPFAETITVFQFQQQ